MNWFDAVMMDPLMGGGNILRVGQGPGMYTSIQAAVDAVPDLDPDDRGKVPTEGPPFTIIAAPGVYEENVDLGTKENVHLVMLPGAKIVKDVGAALVDLNHYCGLYGGYVGNEYKSAPAFGVATKYKQSDDPNDPVRRGIRIVGVTSRSKYARAFSLSSETHAVNCVGLSGSTGFYAGLTVHDDTQDNNTYLINCVAVVERNPPAPSDEPAGMQAFNVDWHGYDSKDLSKSGTVHLLGCVGIAFSMRPDVDPLDGDSAHGIYVEDGNSTLVGCSMAGLLDRIVNNRVGYGYGARWQVYTKAGGTARAIGLKAAGYADPGSNRSEGKGIYCVHEVHPEYGYFAANLAVSAQGGRLAWPHELWALNLGIFAAGGASMHLATPVLGTVLQDGFPMPKVAGLLAYDRDAQALKYCNGSVWKTIAKVE